MSSTKIAFTSCARYHPQVRQTVWLDIAESDPDYLLLLGDQIYMDFGLWPFTPEHQGWTKPLSVKEFASVMRSRYEQQWAVPEFAALLAQMRKKRGLLGVYDDHDFAWNNVYGADTLSHPEYLVSEKRDVARAMFHEFMNCAPSPPNLHGVVDTEHARIILLDNRYYATPAKSADPVLMGAEQMQFLSTALDHQLRYTLVAGGLTLTQSSECWSKYKREYGEFCTLVKGKPVAYLGGDVHRNVFVPPAWNNPPCYELISSGASVGVLGLPFEFDRRRNWTLLEVNELCILVNQYDKSGVNLYRVRGQDWGYDNLGRRKYVR